MDREEGQAKEIKTGIKDTTIKLVRYNTETDLACFGSTGTAFFVL
jgi:hypothetical protein